MPHIRLQTIFAAAALFCGLSGIAIAAQDRFTLKVPDGLRFAEFKGGRSRSMFGAL